MISLLFFSRSRLRMPGDEREIDSIVTRARARNAAVGVTGALVFTFKHFAQILEGQREQIDMILARMQTDPRHEAMRVVDVRDCTTRHFDGFSLAYCGPSLYVERHIKPLIEGAEDPLAVDRLRLLLCELARTA
ncbi:MAG TPA: BLUF domain-containing protein [Allosphingosinicella sp.]|jgi:hypothetical protein